MKNKLAIHWYDEIDSTNSEMQRRIDSLEDGSVIAAVNQYAGKGQRGNSWLVQKGVNLTFSILLKFNPKELPASRQFEISEASALGVRDYLLSEGIVTSIKWPNDIYFRNKKICGMLIENTLQEGCIKDSIIGIGLNVNQTEFPASLVNPVSMTLATKKTYSLKEALEKLCDYLQRRFSQIGTGTLINEYEKVLYRFGEFHEYVLCPAGTTFQGRIVGVKDSGLLQVETEEGELREFAFKEISYVI